MSLSLKGKIAFITGASSGIGKASAEKLAALGAHLILTARRKERLEKLAGELQEKYHVDVLALPLDVQNKEEVAAIIESLPQEWRAIDLLLNNAGLALTTDKIQDGNLANWDTMINVNLSGLLYVTRQVLPGMIARNVGHIINISSVAGHDHYPGGNVYSATKHAVRAISKSLRLDLMGTALRVSDIAPGMVETEFSEVRLKDQKLAKQLYSEFMPLTAEDIADAVVYCATRPLHVDVAEMIIFPTAQASVHHVYKKGKNKLPGDQT